ncbi:hexosaminidase [Actinokineospora alba]|uniref:Hexosaminidase n=1 Tax=Actinokineospora alba TaxID=504798 RepID=A0A1H0R9Q1_9PSEU|nr:family 20 glycosylhydrolase [Actinokineospora alba]TDP70198.1 hexosaminidase [Actinokineospora alba]SDI36984.1 hexosaminidase [Actinokineospora alba]SDP25889.1 hexosaminidase [Actinokineospora alba]
MASQRLLARVVLAALLLVTAVGGIVVGGPPALAAVSSMANEKPRTIPALREWTGGTGSYSFSSASRIVRDTPALASTSQTFVEDLKSLTGNNITQVAGTAADLRAGDILLSLGSTDTALGAEGYALSITDRITVSARDDRGAFYGTRTILQLLKQGTAIPQGTARDWALKPERGLMVDNGRKYFTPQWLRDHVKELAYLKLNYFHLHLSDNKGFRIESTKHPEYVSAQHLTKQEVTDLIALAAKYKITVVPELDAPGHMDPILAAHPELKLVSNTGAVNHGFIDLSKDAAYTLIKDIYDEYLPLFPGPYFHIGADEYVTDYNAYPQLQTYARAKYGATANAKDAYLGFVNWANGIVRASGKTTRAWNDGLFGGSAITVNPNIIVEFWYNYGLSPQKHLDNGHLISNESWTPTYYVLYSTGPGGPSSQWGYDTWNPDLFQGSQTIDAASRSKNLGSKLHIWCDYPEVATEARIAADIRDGLRMIAQQTWGSPKLVATWSSFTSVIAAIGRNPAWPSTAQPGNLAFGKPVTVSSTETPSFPGSQAVDGDYATRWSSGYTDGERITVDLGSTKPISRVKLTWEAAYGRGYRVETSNDGTTWTAIHTTTAGDGGVDDLTGLSGSGRYVRMQGTQRATTYGYSLHEFEVYSPSPVDSGATYQLTTSGKAIDVPGSATATGTQLIVWAPHTGNNQRFVTTANGDGTYTLKNVHSGLCVDVNGGSATAGAAIIQWTCTGGANQRWSLVAAAAGGYALVSQASGLAITAATATDGAKLTQQPNTGATLQRWTFTKV